jgi:hypothetical protein
VSSVITWIPAFAGTTMQLRLHSIFQRIGWLQEDAIALAQRHGTVQVQVK